MLQYQIIDALLNSVKLVFSTIDTYKLISFYKIPNMVANTVNDIIVKRKFACYKVLCLFMINYKGITKYKGTIKISN